MCEVSRCVCPWKRSCGGCKAPLCYGGGSRVVATWFRCLLALYWSYRPSSPEILRNDLNSSFHMLRTCLLSGNNQRGSLWSLFILPLLIGIEGAFVGFCYHPISRWTGWFGPMTTRVLSHFPPDSLYNTFTVCFFFFFTAYHTSLNSRSN